MGLDNDSGVGAERVLALIKRRGAQRAADVAAALGISGEAARQQLERLLRLGLVCAVTKPRGVGRPAREWLLTDAGHARFPDRHGELTVQLIEAVRDEFGEPAVERLISRREGAMRAGYRRALAGSATVAERVARLAAIRSDEGYMAEATAVPGGWMLAENHCPICSAATVCQGFCRSELDVFRAVLGPDVAVERTEHLLAGARRCAYLVTEVKKGARDGVDRRAVGRGTRRQTKDARPG